ncbi:MAG: ribulokinase [Christensenellaceae bacterium]|jgi:L-ribulokinase|nr:ribulokinase [Christensenellaceae bacterium]
MKVALGIDFGTLSARALLVELGTGRELGSAVSEYRHGVMDQFLPSGRALPQDFALQHPQDYLDALCDAVPRALKAAGARGEDVVGLGIDFTACTMLPTLGDGTPLCLLPEYGDEPHAYVKLWKHHAAQDQANRLNEKAAERGEEFLARYGGKISSEWMVPKIWQILEEQPAIYARAERFIEAADWVIWQLCGSERRNACTAGYKAIWHKKKGYPSKAFFKSLDARLENLVEEKLGGEILAIGQKAGDLSAEMAQKCGLPAGIAIAVANVDAHVSVPALGIQEPGSLLMIMGTSTCHIMIANEEKLVPGMCGVVEDGVLPGMMGYEAGQSCVGDHFNWFVENLAPAEYKTEAQARGIDLHALLTEKARGQKPGESGLLALDWWNGNRSVLVDVDLTGALFGLSLLTRPEEIYRALIEATAYGTRKIIETFEQSGLPVTGLYACGGIAEKNAFAMQLYADVTGREIKIARSSQSPALGSAMFGAVAAGRARGGYDSIFEAAKEMGGVREESFLPIGEHKPVYDALYAEYSALHDFFGRGGNDVMKRLKKLRAAQRGRED